MVSRSVLAAWSLAAVFGASSLGQSTASQPQNPAQPSSAPAPTPSTPPKLQLEDLPPEPRTLTPAELQQEREQQVLNAAIRLATLQAHWGPEMDTAGLSMALTEVGRIKTPEGTQVTYRITGTGFTPADRVMLVRWPLNEQAKTLMGGIGFNTKGVAVCSDTLATQQGRAAAASGGTPAEAAEAQAPVSKLSAAPAPNGAVGNAPPAFTPPPSCAETIKPNQPVEIVTTAAPGEAVRVALVTEDRKRHVAASTIPFPIANEDKGCRLQVILGMKDAGLVLIDGTGFPANAALKLEASTGDQVRELHPRANAEGRIVVPLLTGGKGAASGVTTVKFAGINRQPMLDTSKEEAQPDPGCAPSVSYSWGGGSYKAE
ncbi:MAG TPA: hypothetical protein VL990_08515 [Acidobacteriaceae bacterium]|nr:hypothetical protein [Acidobacteriaceae bacterium]